jgi:DNA repair exonuclease SbcCD ATPase subunit
VTAQETQEQLKLHVQDLVQHAMESTFPGKYQFRVDFELKNGRTAAEIYLLDNSGRRLDPVYGNGGGLVEVVAFALRVVGWSLARTQNTILMDEPFSKVSANLRPAVIGLLRDISTRLGLQILMVTHDEDMMSNADRIFTVTQRDGQSKVTQQEGTRE